MKRTERVLHLSAWVMTPAVALSTAVMGGGLGGGPAADEHTASSVLVTFACDGGLLGDVTGDGIVDVGDAQQLLRASASLSVTSTVQGRLSSHGDVNQDGLVDVGDAQQVLRYSASLSVSYPIGDALCGDGDVIVRNQTTGPLPGSPYTVTLDGGGVRDMPPGTESQPGFAAPYTGVTTGSHTVAISNVPGNCSANPSSQTFNLTEGGGVIVNFVVNCS